MLRRKIDKFLLEWKNRTDKKPLIVSGARQIGKTTSIRSFGNTYESFIEINFVTSPKYKTIFNGDYSVESIVKEISLLNPGFKFIPNNTLIFFDEIQEYPDAATSLKFFSLDGRYDVICSGSLLGIHYKKISSIPVGFKENYEMYSMDFEEFLWANGYSDDQIEDIYNYLLDMKALPNSTFNVLQSLFKDYIFVGGYPESVDSFISNKTFGGSFNVQKRIYRDYEDDIVKYVEGLDMAKIKNIYRHISTFLARDSHKFQITKLGHGARAREYSGCEEWLKDAGIINIAYNLSELSLPLNAYEIDNNFRIYFADHSLFFATLDEDAKDDLIINGNYEIYNGALFESIVSEEMVKNGLTLNFYKTGDSSCELDFILRCKNEIIPLEVKRNRGRSASMNFLLEKKKVNYGIKLSNNNLGYVDNKFTIPYFLTFMLKRFLKENKFINW